METNGREFESWYYFIKFNGNESELNQLQKQLQQVEWYMLEELSTFDLDLDSLVSEQTAKEMIRVDLNHTSRHRKFDGKLLPIDFRFHRRESNDSKICKVFDTLGYGQIGDMIDQEEMLEEETDLGDQELSSVGSNSDSDEEEVEHKKYNLKPSRHSDRSSSSVHKKKSESVSAPDLTLSAVATEGKEKEKRSKHKKNNTNDIGPSV